MGRCQWTRLCSLSPQNRPGCPGQSVPHPVPLPSSWEPQQLWQEEQGPAAAGHVQLSRTRGEQCGRAGGHHSAQPLPAARGPAGHPQAGTGWWSQTATVSLPLQMPASLLLQPPCQAWQESPQADTSLSEGLAQAWLCAPVCDSSLVPPRHQPPGGTLAQALSPAPTQGAWHARRSRAGQQAPPSPQGAGWTATYPLCWGVQAGARGAYVTGFVTSPGRGFGGEPAPKGRAVLLRAVLGAKLYFRGSEQGSES